MSSSGMLERILDIARADERVRAVYMNGSRVNPNVPRDVYQDYDVVFVVTETGPFLENRQWLDGFGRLLIMQEPDSNDLGWGDGRDPQREYAWLMLFDTGERIDLTIRTRECALADYGDDSLTQALLDKDGILPSLPPASDCSYWIEKPALSRYRGCCNEFWWCLQNVAKGIARDELPYAMNMYHVYVRDMLVLMLEWHIGCRCDFKVSAGKSGKYFKKYLPEKLYEAYAATFSDANYVNLWDAVFTACALFGEAARYVGQSLGYTYGKSEEEGAMEYLRKVRSGEYE